MKLKEKVLSNLIDLKLNGLSEALVMQLASPDFDDMDSDIMYSMRFCCEEAAPMGLGAGGLMTQHIYEDEFGLDVWDTENTSRCFLHLVDSQSYYSITGKLPPHPPVTQKEYDVLELQQLLQEELQELWQPPAGLSKDLSCEVAISLDTYGKVKKLQLAFTKNQLMYLFI